MALRRKNIADCYIGIVNFCQWIEVLAIENSNSLDGVTGFSEPGQSYEIAETLTENFKDLWTSHGVWDIVEKY